MSKIICDVCGTSYPETATQCPICGCVRPADAVTVASDSSVQTDAPTGTYTYVKGGRFSKANVKKRNSGNLNRANTGEEDYQPDEAPQEKSCSDKGLIIAICVLLLAIIAVVIYIALHFFGPGQKGDDVNNYPDNTTTVQTQPEVTTEPSVVEIPCVNITTSDAVIEFSAADAAQLLNVTLDPVDTTDEVSFSSSDETVATVTESGKVVAVGPGQAVITIYCGNASVECRVVCNFDGASTDETTDGAGENTDTDTDTDTETDTNTPGTSEYDPQSLSLRYSYTITFNGEEIGDITLSLGEGWAIYLDKEGKIPSTDITFKSSAPDVCSVDNRGNIKAVGVGQAFITAEYMGHKVMCHINCRPAAE